MAVSSWWAASAKAASNPAASVPSASRYHSTRRSAYRLHSPASAPSSATRPFGSPFGVSNSPVRPSTWSRTVSPSECIAAGAAGAVTDASALTARSRSEAGS